MTAHNRERYIGNAIESVLAQWFRDFELIVMDDASADATLDIAKKYARMDSRVRVVENRTCVGQFANRNRAAEAASGLLLKYHDSDDLMYPHCLAVMVPPMLAMPGIPIGISMSRAFSGGPVPMVLTPRQSYEREFFGMGLFTEGPAAGIFRREEFVKLGGFQDVGIYSDTIFWLHACARANVLALPGNLYWYRIHGEQALASSDADREYGHALGLIWKALDDPQCPLKSDEIALAKNTVAIRLIRKALADVRHGHPITAVKRLSTSLLSIRQIVAHAKPHQHSLLAGTPLSESGEYLIPDWKVFGDSRPGSFTGDQ
jgi:glycosyltransferase involved in cell wall biosynthesis